MATTFPESIQTFPQMKDIVASDGALIEQYQQAMEEGNYASARRILTQIPDGDKKILTADYLNTITDTCVALQKYYSEAFSSAYVVSATQPVSQQAGDFWFAVQT